MSAATMQASRPVIPENKTKKVSPSLIAVYVLLIVLAVVVAPGRSIYTVTTSFKSVAEFTSNAFNFFAGEVGARQLRDADRGVRQLPGPELARQLAGHLDRVRGAVRVHRRSRRFRLLATELQIP